MFRAWDRKLKKMIFTDVHVIGEVMAFDLIDGYCFETKGELTTLERMADIELSEYCGNKDKKGNSIYEGDIRRDEIEGDEGDTTLFYICVYITEWSRFAWLNLPDEYDDYLENGIEKLDHPLQETFGVFADESPTTLICGNVFEHPNLLNPQQDEV